MSQSHEGTPAAVLGTVYFITDASVKRFRAGGMTLHQVNPEYASGQGLHGKAEHAGWCRTFKRDRTSPSGRRFGLRRMGRGWQCSPEPSEGKAPVDHGFS